MPVFSYLAIPKKGLKDSLCTELAALEYCQIIPAQNQDVIVLVTDTPDVEREESLQHQLKNISTLQSLSLSFGYDEKE